MAWIALVVVAAVAVAATVAAQEESGGGMSRPIDRAYAMVSEVWGEEVDWAGEVPFSGETSDFGGRCSGPSDFVFRSRMEGFDNVFGRFTNALSHCAQLVWGVDTGGAPMVMGLTYSDQAFLYSLPDGSTLSGTYIHAGNGYDAETGQITDGTVMYSFGDGTGRLAGATMFGSSSCRYVSDEAVMAGMEPLLCYTVGTIRYDPFAGQDR
jgi:hypothetical protein